MKRNLSYWLAGSFILVIIFGTIYGMGQSVLRSGANDPQIEIAEDMAGKLSGGKNPADFLGDISDVRKSPALFFVIYDDNGKVINGTGVIDGGIPTPPHGVFDYARAHGEDRITWQPQKDVRLATVVRHYDDYGGKGFVLAARSLKEVEKRENLLLTLTAVGGLIAEAALTVVLCYRLWQTGQTADRKK